MNKTVNRAVEKNILPNCQYLAESIPKYVPSIENEPEKILPAISEKFEEFCFIILSTFLFKSTRIKYLNNSVFLNEENIDTSYLTTVFNTLPSE